MPDTPQDPATPRAVDYSDRAKRQSFQTIAIIAGLIVFIMVVFGFLFGAGRLIA